MQGRRHGRGVWTPLKPGKMQEGEESIDHHRRLVFLETNSTQRFLFSSFRTAA